MCERFCEINHLARKYSQNIYYCENLNGVKLYANVYIPILVNFERELCRIKRSIYLYNFSVGFDIHLSRLILQIFSRHDTWLLILSLA